MLTWELVKVEIAVLRRQGMSIRAIARHFRCSRQTIRRYVHMEDDFSSARYSTRDPHPFKTYINECVGAERPL